MHAREKGESLQAAILSFETESHQSHWLYIHVHTSSQECTLGQVYYYNLGDSISSYITSVYIANRFHNVGTRKFCMIIDMYVM